MPDHPPRSRADVVTDPPATSSDESGLARVERQDLTVTWTRTHRTLLEEPA